MRELVLGLVDDVQDSRNLSRGISARVHFLRYDLVQSVGVRDLRVLWPLRVSCRSEL